MINIKEVLDLHVKYLAGEAVGKCANFRGANLEGVDLTHANLRGANLRLTNLTGTNLTGANLTSANLTCANLEGVNLIGADLSYSNLGNTKFTEDQVTYIQDHVLSKFEKNRRGNYIAYKTFGFHQRGELPEGWILKQRCIIEEPRIERSDRITCGPGINVATLEWVHAFIKDHHWYYTDIWKVELLRNPVVPLASDGKIRCEKVKLIRIVE